MTGFRFVQDHQAEHRVTDLCRVADVSRSSFYAWSTRPASMQQQANDELLVKIRDVHERSRRTYGAPRVCGQLRRHSALGMLSPVEFEARHDTTTAA